MNLKVLLPHGVFDDQTGVSRIVAETREGAFGLLTFPQAVGVVLGASLGTTGTGWIVSVLGLKVSVAVRTEWRH